MTHYFQVWIGGWLLLLLIIPPMCRCCRHHDLGCPVYIWPGQTKYGTTNMRLHMVSHCSCDQRFRSCLKMAKTDAADSIGNIFFNILKEPCIVFSMRRVRLLTRQYMTTTHTLRCVLLVTGGVAAIHMRGSV